MNEKYLKNLEEYSNCKFDWETLKNKTIMISGATGLIGRYFIDLLMLKNNNESLNCKIIAISRNKNKIETIFENYLDDKNFEIIEQDVTDQIEYVGNINYIIHAASNTYPIQYATDPIGTIKTNVLGTINLLELGKQKKIEKFLFTSSFEVYGKVNNKNEIFENDYGYIDCTEIRSCYPESKRLSETLCIAYSKQENINTSIVRLSRVFGPTMDLNSSLATAQFLKNGIHKEDIVLKSDGEQLYSFNYVGDAVMSILYTLIYGEDKQAYNISDESFNIKLKDFANIVANNTNTKVIFDLPDEVEKIGFSNTTMTILNNNKIKSLGWKVNKDINTRIKDTIEILTD